MHSEKSKKKLYNYLQQKIRKHLIFFQHLLISKLLIISNKYKNNSVILSKCVTC